MLCFAVFSDEKRIVTGGDDGAIRVWNLETKSQIWFILKHKARINCLALGNAEDLVLSGSYDTTVRIWSINLDSQIHKFVGHTLPVMSVLFSQDQTTGFSGSYDKTIRSWNLKSLTPQRTVYFQKPIFQICLIRKEQIIVAFQNSGSVSFFNFKDSKHTNTQSYHNFCIASISFTQNEEHFITGSEDGTVEVWLTNGLKRHFFQKKHSTHITSIIISTCSSLFATGSSDRTVIIWDFNKLHTIRILEYQSGVYSLNLIKSSNSLLICWAFGINWCSLSTFVNEEKIKTKPLNSIAISSDLKYLAYGYFCVCLIDFQNKTKVSKSSIIKKSVFFVEFSPSSAFLGAGYSEGEIAILSIPSLIQLRTLYTKLSRIDSLCFSPSNELIGFCDRGKNVVVMSIEKKEIVYENDGKSVASVCFCSKNEKFIYSDGFSVYVLTKNFTCLIKIDFKVQVIKLFVNEDNIYVLVRHFNTRLSVLNSGYLEKIFENESRKFAKEWCTRRQNIASLTHLSL